MTASSDLTSLVALTCELTRIGSPTGKEFPRLAFIKNWLEQEAKVSVVQDEVGNLLVDFSNGAEPLMVVDAHVDTVFDDATLEVEERDGRLYAPGIFDNTVACAMLMHFAKKIRDEGGSLPVLLSWTVGEEGQGNLLGVRHLVETWKTRLEGGGAIILDLDLPLLCHVAVGSQRYRVEVNAKGGHSWNDAGATQAIHIASQIIQKLLHYPWTPSRVTCNIGKISGGTSINALAENCEFLVDLRAVDAGDLEKATQHFQQTIQEFSSIQDLSIAIEDLGHRPAGSISETHPLVQELYDINQELGLDSSFLPLSTNANAFLGAGIPAVCIGIAHGGDYHRRSEYLDPESLAIGWQKLLRILERLRKKSFFSHDPS